MQVILLEKVTNLGKLGDVVNVKPGYGRNFLIPRGKAVTATAENRAKFDARRAELERHEADLLSQAQARREKINQQVITIPAMAGEEGKLFGSIGTIDIAEAMTAGGLAVEKQEIRLPSGPLRTVGEHTVDIHLHPDVDATVTVNIVPET